MTDLDPAACTAALQHPFTAPRSLEADLIRAQDYRLDVGRRPLAALLVTPPGMVRGAVAIGLLGADCRHASRNRFMAAALARHGVAALLVELLQDEEETASPRLREDMRLLASRVTGAARWLRSTLHLEPAALGLLGTGEAGAAALLAASGQADLAGTLICAAARLELTGDALLRTATPTLLLVGDGDRLSLRCTSRAFLCLRCEKRLDVIHGAGARFDEPGSLDRVMERVVGWLTARWPAPTA